MEFSFIHVSDIHLDRPFSGLNEYSFDDNLKNIYKNAIECAFNNVIDFAIVKNVDFVFIAGDTFDSSEHDFSSKLILKRGLQRLLEADICVYLICGNHDPINSYSKNTFNFNENSKIKIIGLNTPSFVNLSIKNKKGDVVAALHALSFSEEKFNQNPAKIFPKAENGFNIGLLHCDLNGDNNSPYAPCLYSELKELNYDYFALGHIHIPSGKVDNIMYSGTIQGRNTKETGGHGIRYVKVSNNKIEKNTFIPTDVIRFENIYADISPAINSVEALDIIEEKISEKIYTDENSCKVYLIRPFITGCCSCFNEINSSFFNVLSDKIKNDFKGKVYISNPYCDISAKIDESVLIEDSSISGEIYKTANNNEILENSFAIVEEEVKNLILNCNFSAEEYENFRRDIIHKTKEECKNISSIIYETDGAVK